MRKRAAFLSLAVLAVATGAQAQVTRCGVELGVYTCRTEQPNQNTSASVFQAGQEAFQRSQAQQQQFRQNLIANQAARAEADRQAQAMRQQQAAVERQDAQRATASRVANAVAAGQCEEAKRIALVELADVQLADAAMRVCTPAKP